MIASTLITGLALGSMYGLMALGFHVTYAVSKTVNFSQGSSMMFGAVMGYTFMVTLGWPFWSPLQSSGQLMQSSPSGTSHTPLPQTG